MLISAQRQTRNHQCVLVRGEYFNRVQRTHTCSDPPIKQERNEEKAGFWHCAATRFDAHTLTHVDAAAQSKPHKEKTQKWTIKRPETAARASNKCFFIVILFHLSFDMCVLVHVQCALCVRLWQRRERLCLKRERARNSFNKNNSKKMYAAYVES